MTVSTRLAASISPSGSRRQIGDLWNNWFTAVACSCGHAVASGVWCSARLVEVGISKDKTQRSEAKRSTSGRSEREAGLPRARMHKVRIRTSDQWVREQARLRSLPAPMSSLTRKQATLPQVSSLPTRELPWCCEDTMTGYVHSLATFGLAPPRTADTVASLMEF